MQLFRHVATSWSRHQPPAPNFVWRFGAPMPPSLIMPLAKSNKLTDTSDVTSATLPPNRVVDRVDGYNTSGAGMLRTRL
jgi:hypothetical protein